MVECPYCSCEQAINHDDGFGYAEDVKHEMQCSHCERYFVFETSITFRFEAEKADCLNGAEHNYESVYTIPNAFTTMRCTMCDDTREPTAQERIDLGLESKEAYMESLKLVEK